MSEAAKNSKIQEAIGPVIIRSWPKIIMMWPTLVMAIVCGIFSAMYAAPEADADFGFLHLLSLIFMIVLAINLMLLLYDLRLWGFLLIVLAMAVAVLGIFLLDQRFGDAWGRIWRGMSIRVYANAAFYFLFSIVLLLNLFIAWVITRLNYWKIEHNEIIIHRGFMQEQERHPTAQARFTLVIDDIVEYGILGAGKLVFRFGDNNTTHELTTVPFVHRKAKKLDMLLGRVAIVS
jgi:hypothetical protein